MDVIIRITMKTQIIYVAPLKRDITFYIGQNKVDNFDIIDAAKSSDLWFHAKEESSCHVVCELPDDIEKKQLRYIVKIGALMCKQNTPKLKSIKEVDMIYTAIKNVTKNNLDGCVITENTKTISC